MELILDRFDLKEEHRGLAPSQTKYSHFTAHVQIAIGAVGSGLYKADKNHNAIYPPKDKDATSA